MSNWKYNDHFENWVNLDKYYQITIIPYVAESYHVKAFSLKDFDMILFIGTEKECESWMYDFMRS